MASENKPLSNKEANKQVEDALVKAQWQQAKNLGLLAQGEGLKKSFEHDGLNENKPKGL